ncbi:phosphatidylinositide phosphatase SAC2 isoform X1 [Hydra vulgaris]|uniref:phosphatidylinositide phosphatase SAC2 isoform X1 n=1 Tax=Hydra vulgaris TaxID=6087 RepID=UPI001F5F03B5|nr:phosphatidylinositide phosphatase SAC2 [Hydra vulgaris]
MEFIVTLDNYIIHNKEENRSLWCNRNDGSIVPYTADKVADTLNPVCKGLVFGVLGKMQMLPGCGWKLVLIADQTFVGYLPGGVEVYNITKVITVPLTCDTADLNDFDNLKECGKHSSLLNSDNVVYQRAQNTWNTIKSGASNINKRNIFNKDLKDKDKLERRFTDELCKMFSDSSSFFYSPNGDLTNSRQRMSKLKSDFDWKQADNRFFWNKPMLQDLIDSDNPLAVPWVVPVIQGFVQIQRCYISSTDFSFGNGENQDGSSDEEEDVTDGIRCHTGQNLKDDEYDLIVISRRSRFRAGTRYKRRGVDDDGNVANYVETEQIVCVLNHIISYVQLRGSVPIYWSQPGLKYRPMPVIDRSYDESQKSFAKHFDSDLSLYNKIIIVSLVELKGTEKIIADNYLEHILTYNSDQLTFFIFDFHEYCRGMKFENVSILTDVFKDLYDSMGFYWVDDSGLICEQKCVFRTNCMDCLDRTNVVEAAIAREVLLNILRKLGRLMPDEYLPHNCRRVHNNIWANNGDAISIQYAGTAAMKGDFTRTGERKIAGMMKDGYNSANRYYLNRFKDNYRQTLIDMMLGNPVTEDLLLIDGSAIVNEEDEIWTSEKEECITQLVRHSELSLLPKNEECLGGWALVDPFTFVNPTESPQDEDIILLLTHQAYYVARYSDALEQLFSYQRIPLKDLVKIEIGTESFYYKNQFVFMRLHYKYNNTSGFFHTVRAVQKRSAEESKGILLSIADMFLSVAHYEGLAIKINEVKFDKKRSKSHLNIQPLSSKRTLSYSSRLKTHEDLKLDGLCENHLNNPLIQIENDSKPDIKKNLLDTTPTLEESKKNLSSEITIVKSHSEGELATQIAKTFTSSRVDAFLRKTKSALVNVAPKVRDISLRESPDEFKSKSQKNDNPAHILEFKNSLKKLPEFRNKLQSAFAHQRTRRKVNLTEEELKKRRNCKTKIYEL